MELSKWIPTKSIWGSAESKKINWDYKRLIFAVEHTQATSFNDLAAICSQVHDLKKAYVREDHHRVSRVAKKKYHLDDDTDTISTSAFQISWNLSSVLMPRKNLFHKRAYNRYFGRATSTISSSPSISSPRKSILPRCSNALL